MDGNKINQKILFGYSKSAQKLGRLADLYRPLTADDPISPPNLIGQVYMVVTLDFNWMKPNKYGNAVWYLFADGQSKSSPLSVQEMDYLVDPDGNTYFVLSKEFQMPMQSVQCNAVVYIRRPTQTKLPGVQPEYSSYVPSSATVLISKVPCSILMRTTGERPPSKLPTDVREPAWIILMPRLARVTLKTGDIITDEIGRTFSISVVEVTEFGFRLTTLQVLN